MPRGRRPGPPQPIADPAVLRAAGVEDRFIHLAVATGRLRDGRGWTHQQLADAADLNHAVVAGIEAGTRDPSLSSLIKLCRVFSVRSWDELLGPPR